MLPERIATGVLRDASEASVYEVPRQTRVAVASILLTNSSPDPSVVGAWVAIGTSKFPLMPPELVLGAGDSYHLTTVFSMEPADRLVLRGAPGVAYYVSAYRQGNIPSPSPRAE